MDRSRHSDDKILDAAQSALLDLGRLQGWTLKPARQLTTAAK